MTFCLIDASFPMKSSRSLIWPRSGIASWLALLSSSGTRSSGSASDLSYVVDSLDIDPVATRSGSRT